MKDSENQFDEGKDHDLMDYNTSGDWKVMEGGDNSSLTVHKFSMSAGKVGEKVTISFLGI